MLKMHQNLKKPVFGKKHANSRLKFTFYGLEMETGKLKNFFSKN